MLSRELIERLHESASIRRWNDHIRPVEFTELDKQAHKMIIAYVLGRFEADTRAADNRFSWLRLVEGGLFEFFRRVILTDLKPHVLHRIMREKGHELNTWVLEKLRPEIAAVKGDLLPRFERYLFDEEYARVEKRVLRAAHYLATEWEFNIIYRVCPFVYGIERTKAEIENQLEDFFDLEGVQRLSLGRKLAGFVSLCGQLRFQRRWSQVPRIPETSVLGHMLVVAVLTYLCLREMGASDARLCNGFFAALFHDLPEVLTRDISSPVKNAVEGLDGIIREYERRQVDEELLPLLPTAWHADMRYLLDDEFNNRARVDGTVLGGLSFAQLTSQYSAPECCPVDGEVIRCCDRLAAYIEAAMSVAHGVSSRPLLEGMQRLRQDFANTRIPGVDLYSVLDAFGSAEQAGPAPP